MQNNFFPKQKTTTGIDGKEIAMPIDFIDAVPITEICGYIQSGQECPFGDQCARFHAGDEIITLMGFHNCAIYTHTIPRSIDPYQWQVKNILPPKKCHVWHTGEECKLGNSCPELSCPQDHILISYTFDGGKIMTHKYQTWTESLTPNTMCPYHLKKLTCPITGCKFFHNERDIVIIIRGGSNQCFSDHDFSYFYDKDYKQLQCYSEFEYEHPNICAAYQQKIGYCNDHNNCTYLHGIDDEITVVHEYGIAPKISHRYPYQKLPYLPSDIWTEIIVYVCDPFRLGWPPATASLNLVSKQFRVIMQKIFKKYISHLPIATIVENQEERRYIRHILRNYPEIDDGFVIKIDDKPEHADFKKFAVYDRTKKIASPYAITTVNAINSKNFFDMPYFQHKCLFSTSYTECYGSDKKKISWSGYPVIIIPFQSKTYPNAKMAFIISIYIFSVSISFTIRILHNITDANIPYYLKNGFSKDYDSLQILKIMQYIYVERNPVPTTIQDLVNYANLSALVNSK